MTARTEADWSCPTCVDEGRRGYCAPGRCYCGHPACHAYASYVDTSLPLSTRPVPAIAPGVKA